MEKTRDLKRDLEAANRENKKLQDQKEDLESQVERLEALVSEDEEELQKEYDKVSGGRKKETVVDEEAEVGSKEFLKKYKTDSEEETDPDSEETAANRAFNIGARAGMDHTMEEDDLRFEGLNQVHDLKPMVTMNESIKRMQKLANLRD